MENPQNEYEHLQLEGRNAVLEALNHQKPIDKILIKKGNVEGSIRLITAKAHEQNVIVQSVDKKKLDGLSHSNHHQGVIALCPAKKYVELEDILQKAASLQEDPFLVLLDSITDPHNLGAIIRSAEAAGAHGVIIPKRRAASLTGIVSKTSAGALEHVMIARVTNMHHTVEQLKDRGIWIACAGTGAEGQPLYETNLKGPLAIVIGSEGTGVGGLIQKSCDFTVNIPMYGQIQSLNASVAAGVLMYEIVRQRRFKIESTGETFGQKRIFIN